MKKTLSSVAYTAKVGLIAARRLIYKSSVYTYNFRNAASCGFSHQLVHGKLKTPIVLKLVTSNGGCGDA